MSNWDEGRTVGLDEETLSALQEVVGAQARGEGDTGELEGDNLNQRAGEPRRGGPFWSAMVGAAAAIQKKGRSGLDR